MQKVALLAETATKVAGGGLLFLCSPGICYVAHVVVGRSRKLDTDIFGVFCAQRLISVNLVIAGMEN